MKGRNSATSVELRALTVVPPDRANECPGPCWPWKPAAAAVAASESPRDATADARDSEPLGTAQMPVVVPPDHKHKCLGPRLPRTPAAAAVAASGPPRAAASDASANDITLRWRKHCRCHPTACSRAWKKKRVPPGHDDGCPGPRLPRKPAVADVAASGPPCAAAEASAKDATSRRRHQHCRQQRGCRRYLPSAEASIAATLLQRDCRHRRCRTRQIVAADAGHTRPPLRSPKHSDVPLPPGAEPFPDGMPSAKGENTLPGKAASRKSRPGTDPRGFRLPPDPSCRMHRKRSGRQFRAPTAQSIAWRAVHGGNASLQPLVMEGAARVHEEDLPPGGERTAPVNVAALMQAWDSADPSNWAADLEDTADDGASGLSAASDGIAADPASGASTGPFPHPDKETSPSDIPVLPPPACIKLTFPPPVITPEWKDATTPPPTYPGPSFPPTTVTLEREDDTLASLAQGLAEVKAALDSGPATWQDTPKVAEEADLANMQTTVPADRDAATHLRTTIPAVQAEWSTNGRRDLIACLVTLVDETADALIARRNDWARSYNLLFGENDDEGCLALAMDLDRAIGGLQDLAEQADKAWEGTPVEIGA